MRPGVSWAEAEPSVTTSATRYEQIDEIGIAARIVPELEFVDVEWHVGIRQLVISADHPALEQRPEAFDVLSVNRTDDVLSFGVVNGFMWVLRSEAAIADPLVGREQTYLFRDDFAHKALECRAINAFDDPGDDLTLATDRADDRRLARTDAASPAALEPITNVAVLGKTADGGFINLDLAEQLALGAVLHRDANAMAHVPSGFVGAGAEHSVDLVRAHALFRVVHEECDFEPFAQGIFGVLEDCSGDDGEPIAVLVAALAEPMEGTGFDLPYLRIAAARAMDAVGPTTRDQEGLAVVFGLKPGEEFVEFPEAEYSHSGLWCQVPDNRPN